MLEDGLSGNLLCRSIPRGRRLRRVSSTIWDNPAVGGPGSTVHSADVGAGPTGSPAMSRRSQYRMFQSNPLGFVTSERSGYPLMAKRDVTFNGGKSWQIIESKADNGDFKEAFGLGRQAKWPEHSLGEVVVNGVRLVHLSVEGARARAVAQGKRSRDARRLWAVCPRCETQVCAGHLDQHLGSRVCEEVLAGIAEERERTLEG